MTSGSVAQAMAAPMERPVLTCVLMRYAAQQLSPAVNAPRTCSWKEADVICTVSKPLEPTKNHGRPATPVGDASQLQLPRTSLGFQ